MFQFINLISACCVVIAERRRILLQTGINSGVGFGVIFSATLCSVQQMEKECCFCREPCGRDHVTPWKKEGSVADHSFCCKSCWKAREPITTDGGRRQFCESCGAQRWLTQEPVDTYWFWTHLACEPVRTEIDCFTPEDMKNKTERYLKARGVKK